MIKRVLFSLIAASALYAAQPVAAGRNVKTTQGGAKQIQTDDTLPIATVRSSGGLVLNGVATPAGVNSVVIAHGDVVETLSAPAVVTYRDGRVMNLAPGSKFGVDQRNGVTASQGASRKINDPLRINGLSIRR